jgi:DNA-binding NtrC family response regulator
LKGPCIYCILYWGRKGKVVWQGRQGIPEFFYPNDLAEARMEKKEMTKVLVVDDEEAIRFVFGRFLADAGYEVLLAEHENDAREILSGNEFDVAVVDRVLSDGQSGMDLIKAIKESQPSCEIIMISGFPKFHDTPETPGDIPYAYLTKPVRKDDIVRAVGEAVEKRRRKF